MAGGQRHPAATADRVRSPSRCSGSPAGRSSSGSSCTSSASGIRRIFLAVNYLGRRHRGALRRRLAVRRAGSSTCARSGRSAPAGALGLLPEPPDAAAARDERRPRDAADLGGAARRPRAARVSPRRSASGATSTRCRSAASSATATASSRSGRSRRIEREVNSGIYALDAGASWPASSRDARSTHAGPASATLLDRGRAGRRVRDRGRLDRRRPARPARRRRAERWLT